MKYEVKSLKKIHKILLDHNFIFNEDSENWYWTDEEGKKLGFGSDVKNICGEKIKIIRDVDGGYLGPQNFNSGWLEIDASLGTFRLPIEFFEEDLKEKLDKILGE